MANIHRYYLEHMAAQTGYRATWEPNRPLYLGAIVTLEKGVFTIQSTLEKEGIHAEEKLDISDGTLDYTSSEFVSIGTKLAGQVPIAGSVLSAGDVGFSLTFSSERAVVFQADKTRTHQLANMAEIEREVAQRVRAGTWRKEWLIVSQLLEAETATIICSFSKNSKMELKANADVGAGQLKLSNAALGLNVVKEQGSFFRVIAQKGITPLYRVMGYRHPLFGKPGLETKAPRKEQLEEQLFDPIELESAELQHAEPES